MSEKDPAVSVRARLLNRARREGDEFQRLLVRYAIERLLYRLSVTPHVDDFILKGATLFAVWTGQPHRATKDLDLLGSGTPDLQRLVRVFREIAAVPCPEDGLTFDVAGVEGAPIRQAALYDGLRFVLPAALAGARMKVQVDVGLGDAVVPPPSMVEVPPLLDLPPARLRAYAKETVVAEKLEALVVLGLTTSRMKDLYDLDHLRRLFDFDSLLVDAVRATFARRGTPLPESLPVGLSDSFAGDSVKIAQWRAFQRKAGVDPHRDLADVVEALRSWLTPVIARARDGSGAAG